jgi:hypothetical protein
MRYTGLVLATIVLFAVSGCSAARSIEQWKCDNWGMCHFGIQPSQPCGPSASQPVPMEFYETPPY